MCVQKVAIVAILMYLLGAKNKLQSPSINPSKSYMSSLCAKSLRRLLQMNKELAYYMSLPYSITLTPVSLEDVGGWLALIPQLKDCISDGDTKEEALHNIEEAKELWLEGALEDDIPIPEPTFA